MAKPVEPLELIAAVVRLAGAAGSSRPRMSAPPSPVGFDAAADRYDADERGNRVLAHMRARAFRQFAAAFAPRRAAPRAGLGHRHRGGSVSSIAGAAWRSSTSRPGCSSGQPPASGPLAPTACWARISRRRARWASSSRFYGRGSFDGAYSSFGALNCEPALDPVAAGLAELVRPGGAVVLSIINRWCPAEVGWFAAHGQWREAARRWGGPVNAAAYPGGPKDVLTTYYSRREIERAFSRAFRVEHAEALPLIWPPPYLDSIVARFESLFRALEPVERWAASRALAARPRRPRAPAPAPGLSRSPMRPRRRGQREPSLHDRPGAPTRAVAKRAGAPSRVDAKSGLARRRASTQRRAGAAAPTR